MMQLFYHPMSSVSRAVRILLGEYKIEVDIIFEQEWSRRREFLALNPAGTLPVLLGDQAIPLCGATVIFEYIDETRGALRAGPYFFPEHALARAEVRRLMDWFFYKFDKEVIRPITKERVFKREMPLEMGGGSPDSSILRLARSNIRPHFHYLEWLLSKREWMAGSTLSYADFAGAAAISVLDYLGEIEWTEHHFIQEWYRRIKSRASLRPLLEDRLRGLTPSSHYADLDF